MAVHVAESLGIRASESLVVVPSRPLLIIVCMFSRFSVVDLARSVESMGNTNMKRRKKTTLCQFLDKECLLVGRSRWLSHLLHLSPSMRIDLA